MKVTYELQTDEQAKAKCLVHEPVYREARRRTVKHKIAYAEVKRMKAERKEYQGWNRIQMRKAAIEGIEDIIAPLWPYILRKAVGGDQDQG